MCGIICIVSKSNIFDLLIDSLKQLQNRGYDSSGVGIINNKIEVLKYATTESVDSIQKIIDNKLKEKFDRLWIHGFLHLLGNRHKLDREYLKMRKLENIFFNSIN